MSRRFDGRRAIVTGGASGIGLATAEILAGEGASVAIIDRNGSAAAEHAERIGATATVADLGSPDAAAAVAEAIDRLGAPPTLLAHCVGIYRIAPLDELDAAVWDETMAINLRSALLVGRAVAARRDPSAAASFVFVASSAARTADRVEPAAHYAASKAGVEALVRQMAVEWAPLVRVNAVSPGLIDTPMLRLTDDPEVARRFLETRVPLARLGTAPDVARVIAFLLGDDAAYVTGTSVPVDGGMTIT